MLEELILASSGVDAFEEILKLIYAKLYYEKIGGEIGGIWEMGEIGGIQKKIELLFEGAKKEWPGMFEKHEKIEIDSSHLRLCVEELWKTPLINSDLSIIDSAFENLLPKSAKGSRGQYFTPRHIISEVIKILNPKSGESILDPACGSGGFLLHAFKWIQSKSKIDSWSASRNDKMRNSNIYGIDYDKRMVKIAKGMLLVAGAGKARIFNTNSLGRLKDLDSLSFDIVCTNPPFGGEVRDEAILSKYTLAKNGKGQVRSYSERHILFIERIVNLLKPGGRAGIVVPQGILNNTNLEYVREWLYRKVRVIGVIGLDTNTFKPFTNVKTSLLFVQKWRGKVLADYPIFIAVSTKSGKNLSGEVAYRSEKRIHSASSGQEVKSEKQELKIDSDLPEIAGRLRRFIEREGMGF